MRTLLKARQLLFIALLIALPAVSFAQVNVSITVAPPALPIYAQPACPTEGYLWTPGYWAYGPAGYFWVPGVWVAPPQLGFLWTPGYWGFASGIYRWHAGYWGPHVGFYGGINYGFGYGGVGFYGGRWEGGVFRYNTAVWRVGPGFHGVYGPQQLGVGKPRQSTSSGRDGRERAPGSPAEPHRQRSQVRAADAG